MAKKPDDESGEVIKGKGGARPPELSAPSKPGRGFPFRLLFWAMLMTVAAVAGGYFTWKFRDQAIDRKHEAETCVAGRDTAVAKASQAATSACDTKVAETTTACDTKITDLTAKQREADTQLTKMSENLHATKDELDQLRLQKVETEKRIAAVEEIRKKFTEMTDTGALKVTSRRGSLVVELPSEVLFDSAKATLSRKGEIAVLQVGGILKQFADRRFLVVGHTDPEPLKSATFADNWELSVARALTVTRFLVEGGMDKKNVIAAGAGENDPIAENSNTQGKARNRRIEIVLLPALSELPPLPPSLDDKPNK
jgi:chemotaxis protein MotB